MDRHSDLMFGITFYLITSFTDYAHISRGSKFSSKSHITLVAHHHPLLTPMNQCCAFRDISDFNQPGYSNWLWCLVNCDNDTTMFLLLLIYNVYSSSAARRHLHTYLVMKMSWNSRLETSFTLQKHLMMDGMLESRRGQTHMEHFQATLCKDCTCATWIHTLCDLGITILVEMRSALLPDPGDSYKHWHSLCKVRLF